jgi:diacylglycerol kinase
MAVMWVVVWMAIVEEVNTAIEEIMEHGMTNKECIDRFWA